MLELDEGGGNGIRLAVSLRVRGKGSAASNLGARIRSRTGLDGAGPNTVPWSRSRHRGFGWNGGLRAWETFDQLSTMELSLVLTSDGAWIVYRLRYVVPCGGVSFGIPLNCQKDRLLIPVGGSFRHIFMLGGK